MYKPTRVHTRIELQVLPQIKSDPKVDSQVLTKMRRKTKHIFKVVFANKKSAEFI